MLQQALLNKLLLDEVNLSAGPTTRLFDELNLSAGRVAAVILLRVRLVRGCKVQRLYIHTKCVCVERVRGCKLQRFAYTHM